MGGGGYSETVFQNRGYSVEFGPKFQPLQQAHASQIVSHILRMWRLMMRWPQEENRSSFRNDRCNLGASVRIY